MLSFRKEKGGGFIREFANGCLGYYFALKRVILAEL
jgi:hypothetical protein